MSPEVFGQAIVVLAGIAGIVVGIGIGFVLGDRRATRIWKMGQTR